MHRYRVQFCKKGIFTTDCGFHDGCFEVAQDYVRIVVNRLDEVSEGVIFDTETRGVAYRYVRPEDYDAILEEQIAAVFGEGKLFKDPNGSDGVDDDPFARYDGPGDPKLRYS